jgi:hypothetical protein
LISNFLLKSPIFTCALTSNSCNWKPPNYHMDHINSGGPPTAHTHKISTNSGRFLCASTKFPFTHTPTPCQRWWRPSTNTKKINQIKPTHSPETLAVISKLK